jgi:uncharacterized protein YndB with AHSA1/START domain
MASNQPEPAVKSADFVISRVFDAPRELVWKAFTEPERMKEWWGPKGFSVISWKMDFRPGGGYLYGMRAPDGSAMWGKFVFREIVPPERMVFINSFSDEAGAPRAIRWASWPLELLSTFTFEEEPGSKTKVTVRWSATTPATTSRRPDTNHDSMRRGWGGRWIACAFTGPETKSDADGSERTAEHVAAHFHPLASFCHKVLIALYEADIPFEPIFVDLGDENRARLCGPVAGREFPVLRDEARSCTLESPWYLSDTYYAGGTGCAMTWITTSADVGPLLRPLRPYHAKGRGRQFAPAGPARSLRRGAG